VKGTEIVLLSKPDGKNYICITDIARYKNSTEPKDVVKNWMRNRSTIEFLGLWEKIHNPNFKGVEFDPLLFEAGSNAFTMSPTKWIEITNAIGIFTKTGVGGGTFAHQDIAFEFASWVSSEFKLYLLLEFQRLKEDEQQRLSLEWNLQRTLSKINYRIHTDAIKEEIIPKIVTKEQAVFVYANEADLLNVALFGKTAAQWRDENPANKGNIRDTATLEQLVVLSNMESINALLIRQGLPQSERLIQLNSVAITQMKSLLNNQNLNKRLK
ncbi:MAG: KilA-N domain-containing protein, partial [Planctomycetaceae bacterium]|nr:KilA-N domain-containing protein [Planctomycetaceae bacterium]